VELFVFSFELGDPSGKLEACRTTFMRLELLEPSLGRQRTTAEARQLFGQMANQNIEFANGGAFNLIFVGH